MDRDAGMPTAQFEKMLEGQVVLVADSNHYARRLTRMMLTNLGIQSIYEAGDGIAAVDAIRNVSPDVMILDWDMPILSGQEVMRIVRSPGVSQSRTCPSSCSPMPASARACRPRCV